MNKRTNEHAFISCPAPYLPHLQVKRQPVDAKITLSLGLDSVCVLTYLSEYYEIDVK